MIISLDKYKGSGAEKPTEVLTQTITQNGSQTFDPQEGYVFSSAEITTDVHPSETLVATIDKNGSHSFNGEYNGAEITVDVATSTTTKVETGLISTAELIEEALNQNTSKSKYSSVPVYSQMGNGYKILKYSDIVLPKLNGWNNTGGFPELTYNSESSSVEYVKDQNGNDAQFLFPSTYVINYLPKIIDGTYHWNDIHRGLLLKSDGTSSFSSNYSGSFGLLDDSNNEQYIDGFEYLKSDLMLKDRYGNGVSYNDLLSTNGYIYGCQVLIPSEYGFGDGIISSDKWVYTGTNELNLFMYYPVDIQIVKDEFINLNNVAFKPISITKQRTKWYCCYSLPIDMKIDFSRTYDVDAILYFINLQSVKSITINDITNDTFGKSISFSFRNCFNLKSINFISDSVKTNCKTLLSETFQNCYNLSTISGLTFDFSSTNNTNTMFYNCHSLKTIPVLNTSKVTSMNNMFFNCKSLTTVEGIDFSSVLSSPTFMFGDDDLPNLKHFIVNGVIDFTWNNNNGFKHTPNLDFESIKSILTAMSKKTSTVAKTMQFNSTITDQNSELTNLVAACTSLGWTITGLTIN